MGENYFNVEIELYQDDFGRNIVYLSDNGSSGCKYPYENKEQLKEIIHNYIDDMIDHFKDK